MTPKESLILQLEQAWGNIAKAAMEGDKNYYWRHIREYNNLELEYFKLTGEDYEQNDEE